MTEKNLPLKTFQKKNNYEIITHYLFRFRNSWSIFGNQAFHQKQLNLVWEVNILTFVENDKVEWCFWVEQISFFIWVIKFFTGNIKLQNKDIKKYNNFSILSMKKQIECEIQWKQTKEDINFKTLVLFAPSQYFYT